MPSAAGLAPGAAGELVRHGNLGWGRVGLDEHGLPRQVLLVAELLELGIGGAELLLGVLVLAVEVLLLLRGSCAAAAGWTSPGSAGPKRSAAC